MTKRAHIEVKHMHLLKSCVTHISTSKKSDLTIIVYNIHKNAQRVFSSKPITGSKEQHKKIMTRQDGESQPSPDTPARLPAANSPEIARSTWNPQASIGTELQITLSALCWPRTQLGLPSIMRESRENVPGMKSEQRRGHDDDDSDGRREAPLSVLLRSSAASALAEAAARLKPPRPRNRPHIERASSLAQPRQRHTRRATYSRATPDVALLRDCIYIILTPVERAPLRPMCM